jgi:hypothetical protein
LTPIDGVHEHGLMLLEAAFSCDQCHRMSIGYQVDEYRGSAQQLEQFLKRGEIDDLDWLPVHGQSKEFDDVPKQIAEAAGEAMLCLRIGAHRAAGALARAVVEATAKEKGVDKGNLEQEINGLFSQGHIRSHVKAAAHEIRHFGNDMAHGDFTDSVTKEEAEEVVGLMEEVLAEVFQSPAKVERRRAAREDKLRESQE